ncbi:DUF3040 domain-containing protein [Streptomyces sp. NPDC048352]|uniref:DUF3040 domain-containing protein n=1 Tax=Streptomyces sp. NPDC048352 TaxID=3154718 RepID=UPI0034194F51
MDGPGLSDHERMILNDIEGDLRSDVRLDRRLRTLRRGVPPWTGAWSRPGLGTGLLALVCACLFVRAVATGAPGVLWLFAAVWVVTAVCVLRLACRRIRRGGGSRV